MQVSTIICRPAWSWGAAMGVLLFAAPGLAAAQEWTAAKTVQQLNVTESVFYVRNVQGWAPTSCPGAEYVYVNATASTRKEILAAVMLAKATGSTVSFRGHCQVAGGNYFAADYVIVY